MSKNKIIINGKAIEVEGNNVTIRNGTVYIDGVPVDSGLSGVVQIIWQGDLASLEAEGSVTCDNIYGNVSAGNSVHCKNFIQTVNSNNPEQPISSSRANCNIRAGNSVHIRH